MAKQVISEIQKMADRAFVRDTLMSYFQEVAENFYPERADFTVMRYLGEEFADNLTTSVPLLVRRDLGDLMSSMLRPTDIKWFDPTTSRPDRLTYDDKLWLELAGRAQRNAMYDRAAKFMRATKECDHDYATFGQGVISAEVNPETNTLLYRCWHLRDVAWLENYERDTIPIFRKWNPTAYELKKFAKSRKGEVSDDVDKLASDPNTMDEDVCVYHAVLEADRYESIDGKKFRTPYVSIYFEKESGHVIAEEQSWTKIYVIPRWQTVSGSQYAYSPATVAALPDARLLQDMTLTLLEAGEKAVDPPLIATQDVVRSDVDQAAGGITWVDSEYDERLGDALRPMTINSSGLPTGFNMSEMIKRGIESAFYLDKIGLPPMQGRMTAFETAQRVKEYIQKIIPLFSPIEEDYNGALCEDTFELLLRNNAFGPRDSIPEGLRGADVRFSFRSPISESLDRQKAQSFQEAKAMLAEAIPLDQSAARMIEIRKALRDTLEGIGVPIEWMRSEEQLQAEDQQMQQQQEIQQTLALMQQGGDAAATIGKATESFAKVQGDA